MLHTVGGPAKYQPDDHCADQPSSEKDETKEVDPDEAHAQDASRQHEQVGAAMQLLDGKFVRAPRPRLFSRKGVAVIIRQLNQVALRESSIPRLIQLLKLLHERHVIGF